MLDRLLDFLISILKDVLPFSIINDWEKGIFLRFGKFHRIVEAGLKWKIPFVDTLFEHAVVTTTLSIPTQSLTTRDDKQIVAKAVVKYSIFDIKAFSLQVYDAKDAISDTTQAIVKEVLCERNWEECRDSRIDSILAIKLRAAVKKWGIEIEKVTLTDIGIIRSIRLFNENEQVKND